VPNFYKTQQDAELALTGCYNVLTTQSLQGQGGWHTFGGGIQCVLSGGNDEIVVRDGYVHDWITPFGLLTYTPDNERLRFIWAYFFAGVSRTNYLLDNIDRIDMNESRKLEIKGEAHFLRGLCYMYLGMMYGAVPVYTDSYPDMKAPRSSLQDVFNQVINDFQLAYNSLPDVAANIGRANKWSAAGFLAKVYAYLGSSKVNGVGNDLNFDLNSFDWVDSDSVYEKVREISVEIMNNSGYKLIDRYDYLFRETTKAWQYQECLFTAQASDKTVPQTNPTWNFFLQPVGNFNITGGGAGQMRPVKELYYRYDATDKRRDHNYTGPYNNVQSGIEVIEGIAYYMPIKATNTNYCFGKFRTKDPALKTIGKSFTEGNYPLLRFAEILLFYAEAIYYLDGNEAEGRGIFSQIRERAIADEADIDELNDVYRRNDFIQELLDERSRELCGESVRRFDLVRFNRYSEAINSLSGALGTWNSNVPQLQQNWASHKIWLPIPRTQIELNPNLIQNPGY